MRWFGRSWNAPINTTCQAALTPVGARCIFCDKPIQEDDQGILIPLLCAELLGNLEEDPAHLDCMVNHFTVEMPELPTHCGHCGVPLKGGATVHKRDCPIYPISYQGMIQRRV